MSDLQADPAARPDTNAEANRQLALVQAAITAYRTQPDSQTLEELASISRSYPLIAASLASRLQQTESAELARLIYNTVLPEWRPEFGLGIYNNLAVYACQAQDHEQAWRLTRQAMAQDPRGGADLAYFMARTAQYTGASTAFWRGANAAAILEPHNIRYWSARFVEAEFRHHPDATPPEEQVGPPPMPTGDRPARPAMSDSPRKIVLVGRDFENVASFNRLYGPFRHLPAQGFDIVCVSIRNQFDPEKVHIPGFTYHNVRERDPQALTDKLLEIGPDVLLDLVSHGAPEAYLSYFTRPAPLILGWAGSGVTSGTEVFDAFLTDQALCPRGAERHYTERVLRMPGTSVTVEPGATYPDTANLPADRTGHITFGAFHRMSKVTPLALDMWGRILAQVPESRLILKTAFVDGPVVNTLLRQAIEAHGIAPGRFDILGMTDTRHHQTVVATTDITLTPFPEQGLVTDFDHLWMGIPTIAYEVDQRPCARLTASLATAAGAPFLATHSPEEYVRLAVELADDRAYLRLARHRYRSNLIAAGFTDHAGTAVAMAAAIRAIWQDVRAGEPAKD